MRTFISFEEAKLIVLGESRVLESEKCQLSDALGRTLSLPIISSENLPPFASSAMDGFATQFTQQKGNDVDLGVWANQENESRPAPMSRFRIVEHVAAGAKPLVSIQPGTCARIMTGAVIPLGADTIIPREYAQEEDGWATFWAPYDLAGNREAGKHIRPAGEDVKVGDKVFPAGTVISPPVLGMLASLGFHSPAVIRKPLVGIITTGDEIVAPDHSPGPAQIRNSNGPGLRAQVLYEGGTCDAYDHAKDDPEDIRRAIQKNAGSDLLLLAGGVSVGDHDYVKSALEAMGFEPLFWKVKQRPGKPLLFGKLGPTLVLGLPGNPVSAAMCFAMYARPLIRRFLGRKPTEPLIKAFLTDEIPKVKDLYYFSRAVAFQEDTGVYSVSLKGAQGSNLYGSVARANCILHLPAGTDILPEGAEVFIERLPWGDLHLS
ncbi:MAG: molybdopterin molybdotransferase MoeA [Bacteroidetes bacterium]|nr:molybdopterin molybdotransferase MoeA [Bacteroidota bacterium]